MPRPTLDPEDKNTITALIPDIIAFVTDEMDPRSDHLKRHSLISVLFVCICAQLAGIRSILGAGDFAEASWPWVRACLGDRAHAEPLSHDTIGRVVAAVEGSYLKALLTDCFGGAEGRAAMEHIAVDGKVIRGSVLRRLLNVAKRDGGRQAAMSVNAFAVERGVVLSCGTSTEPGAEHACVTECLGAIDLAGALVSMDAGNSYAKFARLIIAEQGEYLMCVKGNNGLSQEALAQGFTGAPDAGGHLSASEAFADRDADAAPGNRRGDERLVRVIDLGETPTDETPTNETPTDETPTDEATWLQTLRRAWPEVRTAIEVKRRRVPRPGDKRNKDRKSGGTPGADGFVTVYYVSSARLSAAEAAGYIRRHWHVENRLHWVLDVNYGEDASQVRQKNLVENLVLLRRFSYNLMARLTGRRSFIAQQRKFAVSENYRNNILGIE